MPSHANSPQGKCLSLALLLVALLPGCAVDQALLASFNADDDPQLIAYALPTMIKGSETLIRLDPQKASNYLQAGMLVTMYANAFVQMPAERLDDLAYDQQNAAFQRAKKLYLRARRYLLKGVKLRVPSWPDRGPLTDKNLQLIRADNYDYFHWLALSWLAALSVDPLDFELLQDIHTPIQLLARLLQVNDQRDDIHSSLLSLHSALPETMIMQALNNSPALRHFVEQYYAGKTTEDRLEFHFNRAWQLSRKHNPGVLVSMAKEQIKKQNRQRFSALLQQVLDLPLYEREDLTLLTSIYQQHAAWLLTNADNFFL